MLTKMQSVACCPFLPRTAVYRTHTKTHSMLYADDRHNLTCNIYTQYTIAIEKNHCGKFLSSYFVEQPVVLLALYTIVVYMIIRLLYRSKYVTTQ